MRYFVSFLFLLLCKATGGLVNSLKPSDIPTENKVFLITLDGFRWQELFQGADSTLLADATYTHDTTATQNYWTADYTQRRKRLLPFFWNVIATQGQLFGNRAFGNYVNVSNPYRLSYPGYNEILTGRADPTIYSNERKRNQNTTLLEYLNALPAYANSVAAFTSWNAFPYILNKKRSNVYVNCTFDAQSNSLFKMKTAAGAALPRFYDDAQNTRNDWATFFAAQHYIKEQLPKVVFIGLGGTDEYGHQKKYSRYLQQAAQADRIISELWSLVQSLPFYKDHTTFIITTDHGRGNSARNWYKHGFLTEGASQTWLAMLGAGVPHWGELKCKTQLYQDQIAGTVSTLLGVRSFERQSIPVSFYTVPFMQGQ